jgi:hypothetical protein
MSDDARVLKFVNPPLLKNGESIEVETVYTHAFKLDDFLRRQMLEFEYEFVYGVSPTEGMRNQLYPQNYKSAVLDKNGKVVKVIE